MIEAFPKHGSAGPDPPAADVAAGEGGTAAPQLPPPAGRRAPKKPSDQSAPTSASEHSAAATLWYHTVHYVLAILALVVLRSHERSGQCPFLGGGASGLQPCEFLRRRFSGSAAKAATQLHGAIDALRIGTGLVHPVGGGLSDTARGNGGVGRERDAPSAARRRNRDPFSRGHPQPRRQAAIAQTGHRRTCRRTGVPVVPAAVAGMFEVWPRSWLVPVPNPIRVHYGRPILPADLAGLDTEAITALIRDRMEESYREAHGGLQNDMTYS